MIAGLLRALAFLGSLAAVEPASSARIGSQLAGLPEYEREIHRICRSESWGCRRIGVHVGHVPRPGGEVFHRKGVRRGIIDPERCPAHAGDDLARWGIRGPHGNAPIYALEYVQPCAAPELLDWPAISAMVTARRLERLRARHGRRTVAERSHAWRHGVKCRCGEWLALAGNVR